MTSRVVAAVAAVCGLATYAHAQAAPPPPKMLQIYREILKPGHAVAHAKTEAGWPAAFRKANWSTGSYIGMTSVSGPSEAWFLAGWDSFAEYEKDDAAVQANAALSAELDRLSTSDGDHLSSHAVSFAVYREDLSYRPNVDIPEMRYFRVITFRVKPGRTADFAASSKIIADAHAKANMDEHWAAYEVVSGMADGTYLVFLPMKSLADMDTVQAMHGKPYEAALGEENAKKLADLSSGTESSTTAVFRLSPKMSYPPKEWQQNAFWAPPAAAPAKVPATRKTTN